MSATIPNFQILALNDAEASENRIHSDDVAKKYGFHSALVSGVNVFGYLTQPLVRAYGEDWLSQGILDVLFLKPAYQDNLLTISTENLGQESTQRNHLTTARDEQGTVLARLESWLPSELPEVQQHAQMPEGIATTERPEVCWEVVAIDQPAPRFHWQPSFDGNQEYVKAQRDQADVYFRDGALIHPYFLLDSCNKALMRLYYMPAWVHTGSRIILRKPLRVNQNIEMRSMPIKKWERKGHKFIKLYVAMLIDESVAVEVEHTAIFELATD